MRQHCTLLHRFFQANLTKPSFSPVFDTPNVVGYSKTALTDGGNFVTGSFLSMGSTNSFKISEVKIVGYEKDPSFLENMGTYAGDFNFKLLDDTGATMDDREWGWWAEYDGENWAPGFWCLNQSGTPVEGEEDVEIKAGEGLWFVSAYAQIPEGETEKEVFGFQPAGQVSSRDISFKLRDGGNSVGNPMPAGIKLSDITISGYEKDPTLLENMGTYAGDFNFKLLDDTGATKDDMEWGWWAEYDGENWAPGFWCLNQSGTPVEGEEDITIPSGLSLWFISAYAQIPEGEEVKEVFTVDFPTPLNND